MEVLFLEQMLIGKVFLIPDYQREYSWTDDQVNAFIADIKGVGEEHMLGSILATRLQEVPSNSRHFLPATKSSEAAEFISLGGTPYKLYELIDGQQRLTTIMLCLVAIEKTLRESDEFEYYSEILGNIGRMIRPQFKPNEHGEKAYTSLNPSESSRESYKSIIYRDQHIFQEVRPRKSVKLMHRAFDLCYQNLKDTKEAIEFFTSLNSKAKFWFHDLESTFQANILFECQNNRGIPLTNLDKVKNNLIYRVHSSLQPNQIKTATLEKINSAWSKIFLALAERGLYDRKAEDDILIDTLLLLYKKSSSSSKAFHDLQQILNAESDIAAIEYFVLNLQKIAETYTQIQSPVECDGHYVLPLLEARLTGHAENFRTLMIAGKINSSTIGDDEFVNLATCVRDAAFWVYGIYGRQTNFGVSTLDNMAHQLFHQKNLSPSPEEEYFSPNPSACLCSHFIFRGTSGRQPSNGEKLHRAIVYAYEIKNRGLEISDLIEVARKFKVTETYTQGEIEKICFAPKKTNTQKQKRRQAIEDMLNMAANYRPVEHDLGKSHTKLDQETVYRECLQKNVDEPYYSYHEKLLACAKNYFNETLYFNQEDELYF